MRTRQQERAAEAYSRIIALKSGGWSRADKDKYGLQCVHLPAMIHEAGLCQAVAFLQSKAKTNSESPHGKALADLAGVMREHDLPTSARNSDLLAYLQLTREALRSAEWLKRYAEAELKVSAADDAASGPGEGV
jgi:CRISPR-associated protein Cmr5